MLRAFILGWLLVCLSCDCLAATVEEADFEGDFSDDAGMPTNIGLLDVGSTEVIGGLERVDGDQSDSFTFTVGAGQVLDAIELTSLDGDGRRFWGFDVGAVSDAFESRDAEDLWVARLIQGTDVRTDLLGPVPPGSDQGGSGVPDTIGPGPYTIWIQETDFGDDVLSYAMEIRTSAVAVPEPSSAALLSAVVAVAVMRRKRR